MVLVTATFAISSSFLKHSARFLMTGLSGLILLLELSVLPCHFSLTDFFGLPMVSDTLPCPMLQMTWLQIHRLENSTVAQGTLVHLFCMLYFILGFLLELINLVYLIQSRTIFPILSWICTNLVDACDNISGQEKWNFIDLACLAMGNVPRALMRT